MHTFSQPPILKGTEKEQLVQLRQYLYRMSLDLTQAMNNLTAENFAPGGLPAVKSQQEVSQPKKPTDNTEETKQALSELKSLIVKTADLVYAEIDRLEASLSSTYVAQSTFGTFSEEINTQLSATAERVEQNIQYQATLEDTFRGVSDAFDQYVIESGGYIKQGIIGYDGAVPIIGIAIGQDIKVTGTDSKDGKEYEVIDTSSNMSVWTPDKLAFYVNGMEAAYVSNGAFYVADMYVLSRLFIENWQISTGRGLTIKWIGG